MRTFKAPVPVEDYVPTDGEVHIVLQVKGYSKEDEPMSFGMTIPKRMFQEAVKIDQAKPYNVVKKTQEFGEKLATIATDCVSARTRSKK